MGNFGVKLEKVFFFWVFQKLNFHYSAFKSLNPKDSKKGEKNINPNLFNSFSHRNFDSCLSLSICSIPSFSSRIREFREILWKKKRMGKLREKNEGTQQETLEAQKQLKTHACTANDKKRKRKEVAIFGNYRNYYGYRVSHRHVTCLVFFKNLNILCLIIDIDVW